MTDQELLRLAALAAGYELKWSHEWPGGGCLMRRVVPEPEHPGSKWVPWRPLNDDGAALRLAERERATAMNARHGDGQLVQTQPASVLVGGS